MQHVPWSLQKRGTNRHEAHTEVDEVDEVEDIEEAVVEEPIVEEVQLRLRLLKRSMPATSQNVARPESRTSMMVL